MNSPFAKLLLALQEYLATEMPELKFIDQDLNQLDLENPPVQFPCLLIDFPETPWAQMQGFQDGEILVRAKLAMDVYANTSQITPLAVREDALQFYELEHKLYTKLQYWSATNTLKLPMIRLNSSTQVDEARRLRIRVTDFRCTVEDASAG